MGRHGKGAGSPVRREHRDLPQKGGLSQEELGFRASLHRTEISQLEKGVRLARIDTLVKLAGALSVPPGDLLKGMAWSLAARVSGAFGCGDNRLFTRVPILRLLE